MVSTFLDQSGASALQIEAPLATHFTGAGFHPFDHRRHDLLHQTPKLKRLLQRIPQML